MNFYLRNGGSEFLSSKQEGCSFSYVDDVDISSFYLVARKKNNKSGCEEAAKKKQTNKQTKNKNKNTIWRKIK